MTLYRNFASKDDLILAFLERREERWTRAWLHDTVESRAATPAQRLLTIFDVFGEWFARDDFEGCSFINVMLELDDPGSPVRQDSVRRLHAIRGFIGGLAREAGVDERRRLRAPVAHPHEGLHRGRRRGRSRGGSESPRARRPAARPQRDHGLLAGPLGGVVKSCGVRGDPGRCTFITSPSTRPRAGLTCGLR